MAKVFIIREFNDSELDKFAEFISTINYWDEEESVEIVIDSWGWSIAVKDCYLLLLKRIAPQVKIHVIWVTLMSAAFTLFKELDFVYRELIPSAYWMVHMEAWVVSVWDKWVPRGQFEKFKYELQTSSQKVPEFLSEEEKEVYRNWGDIYFSYDRMKEVFKL